MKKVVFYGALAVAIAVPCNVADMFATETGGQDSKKVVVSSSLKSKGGGIPVGKAGGKESGKVNQTKVKPGVAVGGAAVNEAEGEGLSEADKKSWDKMVKTPIPSGATSKFNKNTEILKALIAAMGPNCQGGLYNLILDLKSLNEKLKALGAKGGFGKEKFGPLIALVDGLASLLTAAMNLQKNDLGRAAKKTADLVAKGKKYLDGLNDTLALGGSDAGTSAGTAVEGAGDKKEVVADLSKIMTALVANCEVLVDEAKKLEGKGDKATVANLNPVNNALSNTTKTQVTLKSALENKALTALSEARKAEEEEKKAKENQRRRSESLDAVKVAWASEGTSTIGVLIDVLEKLGVIIHILDAHKGDFSEHYHIGEEGTSAVALVRTYVKLYEDVLSALNNLFKRLQVKSSDWGVVEEGNEDEGGEEAGEETEEEE
ncbi:MAG: hypothetical protein LBJ16_04160 [Holosporaceae bacterium]|jgi:hypothetical protein|nr:hypothetical protein [Holosporaceae bacterium]